MPAFGGTGVFALEASCWSQTRAGGTPGSVVKVRRDLCIQPLEQQQCMSQKTATGVTGMSEAPVAGVGLWVTARVPGPGC